MAVQLARSRCAAEVKALCEVRMDLSRVREFEGADDE